MNVQWSLIRELMFYEFELSHNISHSKYFGCFDDVSVRTLKSLAPAAFAEVVKVTNWAVRCRDHRIFFEAKLTLPNQVLVT